MSGGVRWAAGVAAIAVGALACQEHLTSPGQCPELCPGGTPIVYDTVLDVRPGGDESVPGYVARGAGAALLTSNGPPGFEARAVYRFASRPDSLPVRDTVRSYAVDSVVLGFTLVARDTLVRGLKILIYRLPPDLQPDTATFTGVDPLLAEPALIDTISVPDSLHTGAVSSVLRGATLDRVALAPGTGGVLNTGLKIVADAPTGIRIGSAATFTTFMTLDVPDTTTSILHQSIQRGQQATTFVSQAPDTAVPGTLLIGGAPSSRSFIRFDLPPRINDSATVVRATLELVPIGPLPGLTGDPAVLEARAVLSDLGPKSPLSDNTLASQDTLVAGSADTVRIDITQMVKLWQSSSERPKEVALLLRPEAASFTRLVVGSTSPLSPVGSPRLHVTYLLAFPFESP